jgi:hypothetical protein
MTTEACYELEVCDECDYQWTEGTKPVHRETCSQVEEDNFFDSEEYKE